MDESRTKVFGLKRRRGEARKEQFSRLCSNVGVAVLDIFCFPCIICIISTGGNRYGHESPPNYYRDANSPTALKAFVRKYGTILRHHGDDAAGGKCFRPSEHLPRRNLSEESFELSTTQNSSFLRLPLEVRMLIYRAVGETKRIGAIPDRFGWFDTAIYEYPCEPTNTMSLLQVCKQIYQEAVPVLYQATNFVITQEMAFTEFVNSIPARRFQDIRQLLVLPDLIRHSFCDFIAQRLDVDRLRLQILLSPDSLYPQTRWLAQLESMPYRERLRLELVLDTTGASRGIYQEAVAFYNIVETRLKYRPKLTWYRPRKSK